MGAFLITVFDDQDDWIFQIRIRLDNSQGKAIKEVVESFARDKGWTVVTEEEIHGL